MQRLEPMNSRDRKELFSMINGQWDAGFDSSDIFFRSSKDKVYMVSGSIRDFPFEKYRGDRIGLYFGTFQKAGFRLSVSGSQLIGPDAKRFVAVLDDCDFEKWVAGEDIPYEGEGGLYLICNENHDFLGCGILSKGRLLNHVPKSRRIRPSKQL